MLENVIFDMEVFPKWWCMVYTNPKNINEKLVISSDTENYLKILSELRIKRCLIGFNIKGYDLRILNAILHGCDPDRVYQLSKDIVENQEERDVLNSFNFWNNFNFSDLYDDWRFGTLKEFESNTGMSIKESEISFDKEDLTEEDKKEIIEYCIHDVDATVKLFEYRKEYFESKIMLSEMFDIPIDVALKSTNAKLCALVLQATKKFRPVDYKFKIPERVESYIKNNLPSEIIDLFEYFSDEAKEVNLFDNNVVFGIGGIHSTISENIVCKTTQEKTLLKIDVTSYYPNLMMKFDYISRNIINPKKYEQIYNLRVELKKKANEESRLNGKTDKWKKLNAQQTALKLILNTTYGAMKNQYNALYDEYQASSLCYLGQLLLASLSNKIHNSTNSKIIQTNTDGIMVYVDNDEIDLVKAIVSEWEEMTGFDMEYDVVKVFFQRDVNNYIEVTDNAKKPYELKGKWANQAEETIANLNAPITHKAIVDYYVNGIPVEKTINNCQNIFDFCFTAKTGFSYKKTYHYVNGEPRVVNKINRVVATTDEKMGTLKKYKRLENGDSRYDKIADIPEHCYLMNDDLFMLDTLDKEWYITFTKNKIKELRCI